MIVKSYRVMISIVLIIWTVSIFGMELEITTKKPVPLLPFAHVKEVINPIKFPQFVSFLSDDIVAIAGMEKSVYQYENFVPNHSGLVMFNKKTSEVLLEDRCNYIYNLVTNKKRTRIGMYSSNSLLTVYDVDAKKIACKKNFNHSHRTSIAFNSQNDDEIIIHEEESRVIKLYNYVVDSLKHYAVDRNAWYEVLACHPKATMILSPNSRNGLSVWNIDGGSLQRYMTIPGAIRIRSAEYNGDGSLIAINDHNYVFIIDTILNKLYSLKKNISFINSEYKRMRYPSMAFHPNGKILAVLSRKNKLLYWDAKERRLISKSWLNRLDGLDKPYREESRLSFSCDGKQLLVALKNKCFIVPVPEDKLFFILWVLKKYKRIWLPEDIRRMIIQAFMNVY